MSLEASIAVCLHDLKSPSGQPVALRASGNSINFTCPPILKAANFPANDTSFSAEQVLERPNAGTIHSKTMLSAASNFTKNRQNLVVFGYGVRSTPKRQLMFGSRSEEGYAARTIAEAVTAGKGIFTLSCFVIGQDEHLVDLIKAENELGVIVESVKEGPRVRMVERPTVKSKADVSSVLSKISENYEKYFGSVLLEKQPTPELQALPPYKGETIMLQLHRYESEEDCKNYNDANSMTFVALGDSERPVLCGLDASQQEVYEKTNRVLVSAAGIVSSIKCSRLRIPFGKSKLSQLMRRCYNAEKGNPNNAINGPTSTVMLIHCWTDGVWAEESYHNLSMIRRICNTLGSSGIGSMLRDLTAEKWRLDQDICELRDELVVARAVYDYKPCIYESSKPIANIKEEEMKRVSAIQSKREAAREKQLSLIRDRAKEVATRLIKEQEEKSGISLAALEKTLEAKKRENECLVAERDNLTREYEEALEKVRRKKEEEENAVTHLREEMLQLEEELSVRQEAIHSKEKQLEMAKLDKVKAREAILRERGYVEAMRKSVLTERREQREQWIKQIKDVNEKVLKQLRSIGEERRQHGETVSAKEGASERAVVRDIKTIEEYLPKLISLEDVPVNPEETEGIRRQFDEVFLQEKESYLARIEEEKARKERLEKGLEAYRNRVLEVAHAKKKEDLQEASKKQQHLNSLLEQVLAYLRHGVKMIKVSSRGHVRRRFYFLSDDGKRIHSCELDGQGAPINRRKPPVTIWLRDIRMVVLGVYTDSFVSFSSESQLVKARAEAVTDNGTYRHDPTQNVTPANIGLNNYRAFALLLRGGKSLEVICESDTDCEAWLVGLRRLLGIKTATEKILEKRMECARPEEPPAVDQRVEMKFGGLLDVRRMRGFLSLSAGEAILCSDNHIPPALFLRVKQELVEKARTGPITVYDVRVSSGLDLVRSGCIYDYMAQRRLFLLPW
ncbi:hypothetical protein LSCM1_05461 [Leishmania martiniquensis]|uniref:PH domain-containing protein n=1 Tax=Leishmania martiniquensis TaxID=1580590 RepID=A0A836GNJ6_9TRYP|nr:hypothetical protein LSCM1_05461 [Leishmania martiniquensis]